MTSNLVAYGDHNYNCGMEIKKVMYCQLGLVSQSSNCGVFNIHTYTSDVIVHAEYSDGRNEIQMRDLKQKKGGCVDTILIPNLVPPNSP